MSVLLLWSAALIKNSYIDQLGEMQAPPTNTPAEELVQATAVQPSVSAEAAAELGVSTAPSLQSTMAAANTSPAAATTAATAAAMAAAGQGSTSSVVQMATVGGSSSGGGGVAGYLLSLWQDIYQVLVLSFGENFPQAQGEGPWYAGSD
jgi:hypothetical protein